MAELKAVTFEQIEEILARLATNYSNMADLFYNIFYNQDPGDFELQLFDKAGVLQTYIIPNRSKDRAHLLNGMGNPEGNVLGNLGDSYQDLQSGELYIKQDPNSTIGWVRILNKDDLAQLIIQGSGSPEETVTAGKGTLYIDSDTATIYIKTTTTGTMGWAALGGGDYSSANTSLSNLSPAGQAKFVVKENISNKVTAISSASTDDEYPSAKCVYDLLGNLEEILSDI